MFGTKVLSKNDYENLLSKANNYDSIVATIVDKNPGVKAEDVSLETIQEIMNTDSSNESDPELLSKYNLLKEQYAVSVLENNDLKNQVDNLLNSAGEDGAIITSKSEVNGKTPTLLDFANEHKDNTSAIISMAQKDGFLPS